MITKHRQKDSQRSQRLMLNELKDIGGDPNDMEHCEIDENHPYKYIKYDLHFKNNNPIKKYEL